MDTEKRPPKPQRYVITEASERLGVRTTFILQCIRAHWIHPAGAPEAELDEEDLARLRLIQELKEVFGANDEAISLILHLLDQVYALRALLQGQGKRAA